MQLRWHLDGWADYVDWQTNDKKVLRKINSIIEDTLRHPTEGLGKPEPLKVLIFPPTYETLRSWRINQAVRA